MDFLYNANCGFFDSVNNDRLYSADDMNKPYKRLVCDGVFATPEGTPSADLQVVEGSGMVVKVLPGEGIFAHKWFESGALSITVSSNASANPRIDSVFARVDTRANQRKGSIVYRTGTAAATPTAPAKSTGVGVYEYRLANIYVASNTYNITQANITDCRGSEECPWVSALIETVDTSTLYTQWSTAYEEYYKQSTEDWEDYETARQAEWNQFFDNLTEDLTLSTNTMILTSKYTTTGTVTDIPVSIASYSSATDILMVFINGIYTDPSRYTYVSSGNKITLSNSIPSGPDVLFVVFKSIITGDISTINTALQEIEDDISAISQDSGWVDASLSNGSAFSASTKPGYRKVGNVVYLRGSITGVNVDDVIYTLPVGSRPNNQHVFTSAACSGSTVDSPVVVTIKTNGQVSVTAGTIPANDVVSLATSFSV